MPVSRRRAKERRFKITPEAVEAFRIGRTFDWRQDEFWKHYWRLHHLLGLKPWQDCPLLIDPNDEPRGPNDARSDMRELRVQLEALAGELRRQANR